MRFITENENGYYDCIDCCHNEEHCENEIKDEQSRFFTCLVLVFEKVQILDSDFHILVSLLQKNFL